MGTRRDPLAETVYRYIKGLNGDGELKTLAERAGEPYPRVAKFMRGDMPYPPMTLMDNLLGVFGKRLLDVLRDNAPPAPQRPKLSPRATTLAMTLDDAPELLAATEAFVAVMRAQPGGAHAETAAERRAVRTGTGSTRAGRSGKG